MEVKYFEKSIELSKKSWMKNYTVEKTEIVAQPTTKLDELLPKNL